MQDFETIAWNPIFLALASEDIVNLSQDSWFYYFKLAIDSQMVTRLISSIMYYVKWFKGQKDMFD